MTEPLRPLTEKTSLGYEVIRFADTFLPDPLMPWQRWWLIHALELDSEGNFRFGTVVTLVARQSGKTTLLSILLAFMLATGRIRLALGTAQNLGTAKEAWERTIELLEGDPDLRRELDRVMRGAMDTAIVMKNGARYKTAASTRKAGRGLSVDLLVLDELREQRDWAAWSALSKTTIARPSALTVVISNAGDDASVVLNSLRETALAGTDFSIGIFEWSAPEGCDLDDEAAWCAANPGLGYTITERAIRSALATDPPATFRTEVLCQHVSALDGAIDLAAWSQCADRVATLTSKRDRVVLGLDVSLDQQHVSLVAAAPSRDGRIQIETVGAWDSMKEARLALPALRERINPRAVGWFPGGPAAALAADLLGMKNAQEIKTSDASAACQGFSEQISARMIVHSDDPLLNMQVSQTSKVYSGDGWKFTRRGAGHCDAVYAAAGAVHLIRTMPPSIGKPRIIVAA